MKKIVKKNLVSILSVMALLFAFFAFLPLFTNTAAAETSTSFYMQGTSFRPESDENGKYGIKFFAHLDKSSYNENATYGMSIVPEDLKNNNDKVEDILVDAVYDATTEKYTLSGCLTDVTKQNMSRPFTARAWYSVNEGAKTYTDWASPVSIYTLATQALADDSQSFDTDLSAALYNIVNGVQGANNLTGAYTKDALSVCVDNTAITDTHAFALGDTFTVVGTVKKSTEEAKTLKAYPKVTASASGVIKQVAGTQDQYKIVGANDNETFTITLTLGNGDHAISETFSCSVNTKLYNASYNAETGEYTLNKNNGTDNKDVSYIDLGTCISSVNGGAVLIETDMKNNNGYLPQIGMFMNGAKDLTSVQKGFFYTNEYVAEATRVFPVSNFDGAIINATDFGGQNSLVNSNKSYVLLFYVNKITEGTYVKDGIPQDWSWKVTVTLYLNLKNGVVKEIGSASVVRTNEQDKTAQDNLTLFGLNKAASTFKVKTGTTKDQVFDGYTEYTTKRNATYNETTGVATLAQCSGGDKYTDISYIDLGSYTNGGAVALEFTGKISPQVAFFVSGGIAGTPFVIEGNPPKYEYNGILFSGEAVTDHYRIYNGFITANNAFANSNTNGFDSTFAGRNNLDESKTYVLVLSAIKNTNYNLTITLYEKGDDNQLTQKGTASIERTIAQSVGGDRIVLFGSKEKDLTFKVTVADTANEAINGYK